MKYPAWILTLLLSVPAFAALPPTFNAPKWQQLTAYVNKNGVRTDTPYGTYSTIQSITPPDMSVTHQADYLSGVGGVDSNGQFGSFEYQAVSEHWVLDSNKNWDIDQWIFVIQPQGDVYESLHVHLVETQDGLVVKDDILASSEEEAMAEWSQKLGEWEQRVSP